MHGLVHFVETCIISYGPLIRVDTVKNKGFIHRKSLTLGSTTSPNAIKDEVDFHPWTRVPTD